LKIGGTGQEARSISAFRPLEERAEDYRGCATGDMREAETHPGPTIFSERMNSKDAVSAALRRFYFQLGRRSIGLSLALQR